MLKGDNELILNAATLMDAIQEYLDKRTVPEHRTVVHGIRHLQAQGGNSWVVSLKEPGE